MSNDAGDRVVKWEDEYAGSVGLYDGTLLIEHFDSIEDLEMWVEESERITRGERAALEAFRAKTTGATP